MWSLNYRCWNYGLGMQLYKKSILSQLAIVSSFLPENDDMEPTSMGMSRTFKPVSNECTESRCCRGSIYLRCIVAKKPLSLLVAIWWNRPKNQQGCLIQTSLIFFHIGSDDQHQSLGLKKPPIPWVQSRHADVISKCLTYPTVNTEGNLRQDATN